MNGADLSGLGLDIENEAKPSYDALPKGEYPLVAVDSEIKPTKAGTGKYLAIEFDVIDGEFAGRKVWCNYNINNPNQDAERIGRAELAALCKAVGLTNIKNSEDIHGKPFIAKLDVEKDDPSRNKIKGYKPMEGAAPTTAKPAATPAAAPAASKVPPWKKK